MTVEKSTAEVLKPQAGDTYRCQRCELEIKVAQGCTCDESADDANRVHFECCGRTLVLVQRIVD